MTLVVSGCIRGAGTRLRVTAELSDVDTDSCIVSQSFDRNADELLDVQSDIAREIAVRIEPELARAEFSRVERQIQENLGALDLYHQAQGILSMHGYGPDALHQSIEILGRATLLDPNFAVAHAQLSLHLAYSHLRNMEFVDDDAPAAALKSIERALQLESRDATVRGHTGCALCDLGHHQRGIDILRKAVELDPSNPKPLLHWGAELLSVGELEQGVEKLRYGIRVSPLDERLAYWSTFLAVMLFRAGRVDEAASEAKRVCHWGNHVAAPRVGLCGN